MESYSFSTSCCTDYKEERGGGSSRLGRERVGQGEGQIGAAVLSKIVDQYPSPQHPNQLPSCLLVIATWLPCMLQAEMQKAVSGKWSRTCSHQQEAMCRRHTSFSFGIVGMGAAGFAGALDFAGLGPGGGWDSVSRRGWMCQVQRATGKSRNIILV